MEEKNNNLVALKSLLPLLVCPHCQIPDTLHVQLSLVSANAALTKGFEAKPKALNIKKSVVKPCQIVVTGYVGPLCRR